MTDADLAELPPAAARYLRAMGVVGRPRTWSMRAHLTGRFRLGVDSPWLPMDAWQYNSAVEVARLFRMRLLVGRVLPMWGWDTYVSGTGRMRGKALGLVPVADGSGPEFDTGELTTWLDDAVLMAPGMLLHPRVTWAAAGDDGFRVAVTDADRTITAEVLLDDRGLPRDVRSRDRWAALPGGPVRALWSTPVDGWTVVDGRPRMTGGAAVWHLDDGTYRYAELRLVDLVLDVPP
ncbi:DUF6544 family protein [Candidatus Blastococcus massiliensis]|uniref:DUF6544 family protein n=1 Tax=Candidatus Blastococcus massiliensis TaxID=1470358 RepID=UPI0004BB9BDD|nr:DUF6544 family protein [Candidatus Blastococcus massiliensis]